jgi:hypothetical protein
MSDESELGDLFSRIVKSIKDHDAAVVEGAQHTAFSEQKKGEVPQYKIVARAIGADIKTKYPSGRRPDFVPSLADERKVFIEVKCFWPSWMRDDNLGGQIKGFLFGPLRGYKDDGAIALDLPKLVAETPPGAFGGQLIIAGGERDEGIDSLLDEYARLALVDAPPWITFREAWENPHGNGRWFFLRAFFCWQHDMRSWRSKVEQLFPPLA